jgi:hypothetical protein
VFGGGAISAVDKLALGVKRVVEVEDNGLDVMAGEGHEIAGSDA